MLRSMSGPWRARLVGGGLLALAGLVMFEVPAAYAVGRGAPGWLALAIGLLVFPVLPVTWHLVRQRQRRAAPATAKPSNTTGWERFAFRLLVVGVVVIGGLLVLDRSRVWRGVRHHALWMIPTSIQPLEPDSKLLERVPDTAELIIWLRETADAQATLSQVVPTASGSSELVIAFGGSDFMVLENGDAALLELLQPMVKLVAPHAAPMKIVELPGGIRMWSTAGWAAATGRATALIELMRNAPDTAFLVGAGRPKARSASVEHVDAAVGWLSVARGELEMSGRVTAKSPADAALLQTQAARELAKERAAKPKEFACGSASDGSLAFATYGTVFVARASIPIDQIKPLFVCLGR
jgi:hypothetical protein